MQVRGAGRSRWHLPQLTSTQEVQWGSDHPINVTSSPHDPRTPARAQPTSVAPVLHTRWAKTRCFRFLSPGRPPRVLAFSADGPTHNVTQDPESPLSIHPIPGHQVLTPPPGPVPVISSDLGPFGHVECVPCGDRQGLTRQRRNRASWSWSVFSRWRVSLQRPVAVSSRPFDHLAIATRYAGGGCELLTETGKAALGPAAGAGVGWGESVSPWVRVGPWVAGEVERKLRGRGDGKERDMRKKRKGGRREGGRTDGWDGMVEGWV